MVHRSLSALSALSATLASYALAASACGAPPAQKAPESERSAPAEMLGKRRADLPDDCETVSDKGAPEPLRIPYDGVAKAARCQREVYTIMGGLTHFLGVECRHCHAEPDYAADTHNKRIANWMARELVPRLQKRAAGKDGNRDVWCQDCHAGKAKLLGNPRRTDVAIEWMTTHLVEDFSTVAGKPPKCRDCHAGDWGSPEFRPRIIASELSGLPPPVAPAAPPAVEPDAAPASGSAPPSEPGPR